MTMEKPKRSHPRQQGALLWPIILIGVGVIWLLGNLGILSGANIAALFQLWPLFLIVIGLDMLIGRDNPRLRPLLGLGAVVVLVGAALLGPSFGLGRGQLPETHQFSIPLDSSESAEIRIDAESAPLQLASLVDSVDLAQIQIVDTGQIDMNMDPTDSGMRIEVSRHAPPFNFLMDTGESTRRWDFDLTDRVPLSLTLDLASGKAQLNLSQLQLDQLTIDGGSGTVALQLSGGAYNFVSDHGSGSWEVYLADDGNLQWVIDDLGSGSLTIHVPARLGVQLEIQDSGSGSLDIPATWTQLRGDDEEGAWESDNYGSADYHATLTIKDRGSGSIFVRQQG